MWLDIDYPIKTFIFLFTKIIITWIFFSSQSFPIVVIRNLFHKSTKVSWRNFDTLKLCNYRRLFVFAGISPFSRRNFGTSLEIKLFSRYETKLNLFFASHAKVSWRNFDTLKLCNYRRLFIFAGILRRNFDTLELCNYRCCIFYSKNKKFRLHFNI